MNKMVKFLVGGLVGVVVLGAAYFGAGGGQMQGKMNADVNVSRGELAKIVWQSMNMKAAGQFPNGCGYSDVKGEDWYAFYVCNLKQLGIVTDNSDGSFGVNQNVMRAEAAKLFVRAFDKVKDPNGMTAFGGDVSKLPAPYVDVSDYNQWYFFYVYRAASLKIIDVKGFVGAKFYPGNYLSGGRAQYWGDNLKKALNK